MKSNALICSKLFNIIGTIIVSVCFIFFMSCKSKQSEITKQDGMARVETADDAEISLAIETEVRIQDGVDLNNIDVTTKNGIVTLSGLADDILEKDRSVEIAKSMRGVRAVIDRIIVRDAGLDDQAIEERVEQALRLDPATDSYELDVQVDSGHVTLVGEVESWQEKQLSGTVAKGVTGVRSLDNSVYFNYTENRSDAEIKRDIQQRLHWDIHVDDALINVEVNNAEVVLTGTVGSASEHSQAKVDAWVTGVKSVDASGLNIEYWARTNDLRDDKYVTKTDEEIANAIEAAFNYDPRIDPFFLEVHVDDGHATISGIVDNLKAKQVAEINAQNVVGVWRVSNHLKVRGEDFPTDAIIQGEVINALAWNPDLQEHKIGVVVADGTVTLTGTVNNYFEKYAATDVASKIRGVQEVDNELTVKRNAVPYVYDYGYHHYYPYSYNFDRDHDPVKTDREIRESINYQIWWSPYVNASDITVTVDNGKAVLTGTVDTWREYYSAEKNAFDGGATIVDNDLTVSYN